MYDIGRRCIRGGGTNEVDFNGKSVLSLPESVTAIFETRARAKARLSYKALGEAKWVRIT